MSAHLKALLLRIQITPMVVDVPCRASALKAMLKLNGTQ